MKRLLFIVLVKGLVTVFSVKGQQPPTKYLSTYVQPAPNAASLGKYSDFPISYYTGTTNINIPLHDLRDGAAKTSISLSYHSSGIRVAELASWVGHGWALNAGGIIIRSVRGAPDEGSAVSIPIKANGYYLDSGIRNIPLLPYPDPITHTFPPSPVSEHINDTQIRLNFYEQLSNGMGDCEPDMFTVNCNGYTAKFVFDENRTPHLLTDDDFKIEVSYDNYNHHFKFWIITAPDGVKYYFGENDAYEVSRSYFQVNLDMNSEKPSSWLLTKIVYPNTKDTLFYNYTPETYSYFDLGPETKIYTYSNGNNIETACLGETNSPINNIYRTLVAGKRLTSIVSKNFKIVFAVNPSNGARQDLISGNNNYPYRLDSLKVYNSKNQCIKQYVLNYEYFLSTLNTGANNLNGYMSPYFDANSGNFTSDTKRLKLTSVQEFSGDGLTAKPAYHIKYEEAQQLPRRLSYDVDHWGFSNNYSGDRNDRFMPRVEHLLCKKNGNYGRHALRDSKWPDMQAYSIKSIKDPLGALTKFEFEPHRTSEAASLVGGLRIKKITVVDSLSGISNERNFSYGIDGVLYKTPQYLSMPVNEYFYGVSEGLGLTMVGNTIYKSFMGYSYVNFMIFRALLKESKGVVPLQDFQGNHIGYPTVKESYGVKAEGGYKIYSFMADQYQPRPGGGNVTASRLNMSNYTEETTITAPNGLSYTGIFGNGRFNDIQAQNLEYVLYSGSIYNQMLYPITPLQVDFNRGLLLEETMYDSSGSIIQKIYNDYVQVYNENHLIRGFKASRILNQPRHSTGYDKPLDYDALAYYKLHTGISHLLSTRTTNFKNSQKFESTTSYKYESPYHTQKTGETTITSSGDTIISKTYYSFDYAANATTDNVFAKMKARNMLLPVATRTWKNSQLVDATITEYKDFSTASIDTFINPLRIYALEVANPLSETQASESIAFTTAFNTLIPNPYFKEKASFNVSNNTAKIIEQKLINDKSQALIWDSKLNLPLAQTDNALFADVAYSSFESSETGNWTYAAGSINADVSSPTGSKAYSVSGGILKNGLTSAKKYLLSYWLKSGGSVVITGGTQSNNITGRVKGSWTYRQVIITGTTSVNISGTGSIDEVRLHPIDAQMTSYTYDDFYRIICQTNPNNTISYYEYDSFNRLVAIKDQYGNVIKAYEYNYGRDAR